MKKIALFLAILLMAGTALAWIPDQTTAGNYYPSIDNVYYLGLDSYRWARVYAWKYYGGEFIGNPVGAALSDSGICIGIADSNSSARAAVVGINNQLGGVSSSSAIFGMYNRIHQASQTFLFGTNNNVVWDGSTCTDGITVVGTGNTGYGCNSFDAGFYNTSRPGSDGHVLIGNKGYLQGVGSVVVGSGDTINGDNVITVANHSKADGNLSNIFGTYDSVRAANATALGSYITINAPGATGLTATIIRSQDTSTVAINCDSWLAFHTTSHKRAFEVNAPGGHWFYGDSGVRSNLVLPLTSGTGSLGASGNAWNAAYVDTVNATNIVQVGSIVHANTGIYRGNGDIYFGSLFANGRAWLQGGNKTGITLYGNGGVWIGQNGVYTAPDSSDGWCADTLNFRGKAVDSRTQPYIQGFTPYAKGTRPATPALGDIIAIDGDTTTDSLLCYLGGAWVVLKP
ncbi:MAG: hypothetical protein RDU76_06225 [Candidatus Edwardsbacteria bacterium]|nr:hypothetical protein [Candidatus Edwardsbacteria bacterium]